jgi:hypothetical protein
MTEFHRLRVPDDPKKAAYMVKWILKQRPIMVPELRTKPQATINEIFALRIGLLILKVRISDIPLETIKLAIYTFRYRNYDQDSFLLFFDYLWRTKGPPAQLT